MSTLPQVQDAAGQLFPPIPPTLAGAGGVNPVLVALTDADSGSTLQTNRIYICTNLLPANFRLPPANQGGTVYISFNDGVPTQIYPSTLSDLQVDLDTGETQIFNYEQLQVTSTWNTLGNRGAGILECQAINADATLGQSFWLLRTISGKHHARAFDVSLVSGVADVLIGALQSGDSTQQSLQIVPGPVTIDGVVPPIDETIFVLPGAGAIAGVYLITQNDAAQFFARSIGLQANTYSHAGSVVRAVSGASGSGRSWLWSQGGIVSELPSRAQFYPGWFVGPASVPAYPGKIAMLNADAGAITIPLNFPSGAYDGAIFGIKEYGGIPAGTVTITPLISGAPGPSVENPVTGAQTLSETWPITLGQYVQWLFDLGSLTWRVLAFKP